MDTFPFIAWDTSGVIGDSGCEVNANYTNKAQNLLYTECPKKAQKHSTQTHALSTTEFPTKVRSAASYVNWLNCSSAVKGTSEEMLRAWFLGFAADDAATVTVR